MDILGIRNVGPVDPATSKKLEPGCRRICAGVPSGLGLGLEDSHVPTFWLLPYFSCPDDYQYHAGVYLKHLILWLYYERMAIIFVILEAPTVQLQSTHTFASSFLFEFSASGFYSDDVAILLSTHLDSRSVMKKLDFV